MKCQYNKRSLPYNRTDCCIKKKGNKNVYTKFRYKRKFIVTNVKWDLPISFGKCGWRSNHSRMAATSFSMSSGFSGSRSSWRMNTRISGVGWTRFIWNTQQTQENTLFLDLDFFVYKTSTSSNGFCFHRLFVVIDKLKHNSRFYIIFGANRFEANRITKLFLSVVQH